MVRNAVVCGLQRHAKLAIVLVWVPILLASPVANIDGDKMIWQVALVVTIAGSSALAVLSTGREHRTGAVLAPFLVLAVAVTLGSAQHPNWLSVWLVLATVGALTLRGRPALAGVLVAVAGAVVSSLGHDLSAAWVWSNAVTTLLAGLTTVAFVRLAESIEDLRRTREALARSAVSEERERFSRDLHDLLGHTLSVMVVKAQAVGRLVDRDPEAARAHAKDIEQVGRDALLDVRQAVDAMRSLTLAEELEGARRALGSAGIRAELPEYDGALPAAADQALAWVVREGATNVLRHSGAAACRFELDRADSQAVLTVSDDGVGATSQAPGRDGGLDGLRRRLVAAGGGLEVEDRPSGFRLTAKVPA